MEDKSSENLISLKNLIERFEELDGAGEVWEIKEDGDRNFIEYINDTIINNGFITLKLILII